MTIRGVENRSGLSLSRFSAAGRARSMVDVKEIKKEYLKGKSDKILLGKPTSGRGKIRRTPGGRNKSHETVTRTWENILLDI